MKQGSRENSSVIKPHTNECQITRPLFSIGVTTYNRTPLLRQTLRSIISQTFTDFEVIVGNDYISDTLSADLVGIHDTRIRFVNHPRNLGEVENNNALLGLSRGRYFTWQTDDDLYVPNFLADVNAALTRFNHPPCVFSSFEFIRGTSYPDLLTTPPGRAQVLSGRQFLKSYLAGEIKALGCTGVYDREYLTRLGGVESLSDTTFALYSEHLLLIRAGLLKQVLYIDEPLVKFRTHGDSWGSTRNDPSLSKQAGENFVRESVSILTSPNLRKDFRQNITSVLLVVVRDVLSRVMKARGTSARPLESLQYLASLKKQFHSLKGSALYWKALYSLGRVGMWVICNKRVKSDPKSSQSPRFVRFAEAIGLPIGRRK